MALVVDTETVGEGEREEYWAQAQDALFFPLDFRSRPAISRASTPRGRSRSSP